MAFHPQTREAPSYGGPLPSKLKGARLGEVAQAASIADRLTNIEKKLDALIAMISPVFGDRGVRQALAAAVVSHDMRSLKP